MPQGPAPAGTTVTVSVPASSANLGPGFDALALALDVRDEYELEITAGRQLSIVLEGEGAADLPDDESHLVHRAMRRAWQELGGSAPEGLRLLCRNTIPMGAGMGSSAAAIVAGVALAQALHEAPRRADGRPHQPDLDFISTLAGAMEGHPDNASASVYGGATLSWEEAVPGPGASLDAGSGAGRDGSGHGIRTERLALHPDIEPVVLVTDVHTLSTSHARAVLPEQVPRLDAVRNSAAFALLLHALTTRPELLMSGTRDWLHQEYRRTAYPDSMGVVDTLREAGHAAVISGAGPSVLLLGNRGSTHGLEDLVPTGWQLLRPGVATDGVRIGTVSTT